MATPVPIEELIALHNQGLTYSEIGRQVGISHKNVRKKNPTVRRKNNGLWGLKRTSHNITTVKFMRIT